jgi:HD-like signal output (HDOD) protein
MMMLRLENINDHDLPPIKPAVLRLWQLLGSRNATLAEIAEAVSTEPVLCARIMAIANSPMYRGLEKITSPHKALVRLGLREVRGIVYYLTLTQSLSEAGLPRAFALRKLWGHSLAAAYFCQQIPLYFPHLLPLTEEEREMVYVTGLLHDIGYLVMATLAPEGFTELSMSWEAGVEPALDAEERIFGMTHPVVSAKTLKLWGFAREVQLAVYGHHRLVREDAPGSIFLVKLADYLATEAGYVFNPGISVLQKRSTLPETLLKPDFGPLIQEVSLKTDALLGQMNELQAGHRGDDGSSHR